MKRRTHKDDHADITGMFEGVLKTNEIVTKMQTNKMEFDDDPGFVAEYLKARFVEDVYKAMEKQNLNRSQLAKRLKESRQYIGRVLNENANFTLEKMAKIACALDMQVTVRLYSKEERAIIVQSKPHAPLPFPASREFVIQRKQPCYATEKDHGRLNVA